MLIDTHCHLDFPDFDAYRASLMDRARAAGVERVITISTRVRRFASIAALAESEPNIWCTVGTHPLQVLEETDVTVDELVHLAGHPKCVAIGEAGLDYHYDRAPHDVQAASFRIQIEAARRTGLPIVIHARDADDDMGDLLEDEMQRGAFGAVLHCYSSGPRLARRGLDLGFYLSFSGILTFKSSHEIRQIAADAPLDRLLVETDAPFLAPVPNRGKRNEPAYVADTAKVLAEVKGVSLAEIAAQTTKNAERLFTRLQPARIAEAAE